MELAAPSSFTCRAFDDDALKCCSAAELPACCWFAADESADKRAVESAPLVTDCDCCCCCRCCSSVGSRVTSSGGRPASRERLFAGAAAVCRADRGFAGAAASEPNAAAAA